MRNINRFLITGAEGQLAHAFVQEFKKRKVNYLALGRKKLDITDFKKVKEVVKKYKPNFLLNCAAYNDVDNAENDWQTAYMVNGIGVKYLAMALMERKSILVHFGTDYVFDGNKKEPYTIADEPDPINNYGKSKLLGEKMAQNFCQKHYLIRLSSVFGNNPQASFPFKLLSWAKEKKELKIVDDQIFSPSYVGDIVKGTLDLIKSGQYGLCHMTNYGYCSRYEWAKYILKKIEWQGKILPVKSDDFPLPAKRPKFSVLDNFPLKNIIGYELPRWEEATDRFLKYVGIKATRF